MTPGHLAVLSLLTISLTHNILHKILSEHWSLGPHVAGVRDAAGATLIIIIVILTIHSNHVKRDAQSLAPQFAPTPCLINLSLSGTGTISVA